MAMAFTSTTSISSSLPVCAHRKPRLWLGQFKTLAERATALAFVRERLVFVSSAEMNHLVSISYPDHVRPFLLSKAAAESGLSRWHIGKVTNSLEFRVRERRSLFLGLSDGSTRMCFGGQIPPSKRTGSSEPRTDGRTCKGLALRTRQRLNKTIRTYPDRPRVSFSLRYIARRFSGSGMSYISKKEDGSFAGKVGKFLASLQDSSARRRNVHDRIPRSDSGSIHGDGDC